MKKAVFFITLALLVAFTALLIALLKFFSNAYSPPPPNKPLPLTTPQTSPIPIVSPTLSNHALPKPSNKTDTTSSKPSTSPETLPHTPHSPLPATAPSLLTNNVPFTPQAPLAQWEDPLFQEGCEEASIVMAMAWAEQTSFDSPQQATKIIRSISQYELENYGEFINRSALDTATLINEYYNYSLTKFKSNISAQDIINDLAAGKIIIVPADGQKLNNPHFTPPGPERHMLVIHGWDPVTQEFITNDPGTRFGEGYRYDKKTLFNAIRDYSTGKHLPVHKTEKNMIVVAKQ